jgi:olfactory receptor
LDIFNHSPIHTFLFSLVLGVFTVALMDSSIMVLFTYLDIQLHTSIYFLLSQLSYMDLMSICTTVSKMAFNYLLAARPSLWQAVEHKYSFIFPYLEPNISY